MAFVWQRSKDVISFLPHNRSFWWEIWSDKVIQSILNFGVLEIVCHGGLWNDSYSNVVVVFGCYNGFHLWILIPCWSLSSSYILSCWGGWWNRLYCNNIAFAIIVCWLMNFYFLAGCWAMAIYCKMFGDYWMDMNSIQLCLLQSLLIFSDIIIISCLSEDIWSVSTVKTLYSMWDLGIFRQGGRGDDCFCKACYYLDVKIITFDVNIV